MLDITIGPCFARTNTFSSLLLCCESSCSSDAVCIYSNWLATHTDVLWTFSFLNYHMWGGVDWEKPTLPSSNWDKYSITMIVCMFVALQQTTAALWFEWAGSRHSLSILGFLRQRQSCAGVGSCTAEFSWSSSTCRCTDGWLLPASGAQRLWSKNHRSVYIC